MKILHWAIILIVIVFPVSLICRINVNAKFSSLKDEVRINNAIDTATKDAIDQLISVNEVLSFDGEFGDVIDVTPAIAQEMVDTFFHTMAVNYNIPYQSNDFSDNQSASYIKNYFSPYIPAIVIVAYDGFYIYSLEETTDGYIYQMSSKIPYAYNYGEYTVGYTLGNDIYLYYDGKCYSGRLTANSGDEIKNRVENEYEQFYDDSGFDSTTMGLAEYISLITNDMSAIMYALGKDEGITFDEHIMPTAGVENFLKDYTFSGDGTIIEEAGPFQVKKKEVIIDIITQCLNEEINDHKQFANISGITYEFKFPTLAQQDWINTIDDISFLAFVQGIPIGNSEGEYYNNFALGGSKIVRSGYIYITEADGYKYYHNSDCELLPKDSNGEVDVADDMIVHITMSKEEAAASGDDGYNAYPCFLCN